MPLLIDPPSVSRSQAATRPCPPSAVFRATSAVSPPSLLSRSGASSRARNVAVVRGRSLSQRGQPRSHNARKVTGARCGSCVRPPLISRTPFPPSPPTLCRPPFCLPLAPVWGLVLSRRVRRAAPPRKSTTGGRSRTVAPEPQQPATHDPTDPLHLSTSASSPRCCYHPCSVAVLHPPRCVDLSPSLYLTPPPPSVSVPLFSHSCASRNLWLRSFLSLPRALTPRSSPRFLIPSLPPSRSSPSRANYPSTKALLFFPASPALILRPLAISFIPLLFFDFFPVIPVCAFNLMSNSF